MGSGCVWWVGAVGSKERAWVSHSRGAGWAGGRAGGSRKDLSVTEEVHIFSLIYFVKAYKGCPNFTLNQQLPIFYFFIVSLHFSDQQKRNLKPQLIYGASFLATY